MGGTQVISIESWKLSKKRDRPDVTCMGDLNKVKVQGLPEYSGSWTGFFDDTDKVPFESQRSTVPVEMVLYMDYTNNPELYDYGPAWIDLDQDTSVKDAAKVGGTFEAAGNWGSTLGF
jgi:hypothetical protein